MTDSHERGESEDIPFPWLYTYFDRIVTAVDDMDFEKRQAVAELFNSWVDKRWQLVPTPLLPIDDSSEIS
jgi:hypothetical protein